MYAIIKSGGRQVRVEQGATVEVDRLDANVGDEVKLDQVVLLGGENPVADPAALTGASVSAKVLGHTRGKKVLGMKYKPKKHYRRKVGNRMHRTRLQITDIVTA